ncbi:MAG: bifunctional phosphoribosylaminoimidazolecarboxamide formyltransferase/IMP cyclohydrolase [Myxococcales bacterium]|nr:bifunctional phosphoribosylaminoimidazolecarboxamide formyltransferase/IMP cyclohydrolase [Myxococcales bacterium]
MSDQRLALFSVADSRGVAELAQRLSESGYTLVTNGATAECFRQADVAFLDAEQLTGVPEILDGLVQTLHPAVHGGILARRARPDHMEAVANFSLPLVEIVVVNLYPFGELIDGLAAAGVATDEMLYHVDVAGAALIRAAAGNYVDVLTLVDPDDYSPTLDELLAGRLDVARRKRLAAKAFAHLTHFDEAVTAWLSGVPLASAGSVGSRQGPAADASPYFARQLGLDGDNVNVMLGPAEPLDGGENPHQAAWYHRDLTGFLTEAAATIAEQIQQLPYVSFMDADLAWAAAQDLPIGLAGAVVVKHGNPCGAAALTTSVAGALLRAMDADPMAVTGAVLAVNRLFDLAAARALGDRPLSLVVAPWFDEEALEFLTTKPWLRLIALGDLGQDRVKRLVHVTNLGVLVEQPDTVPLNIDACLIATKASPAVHEWRALDIAWRLCKHAKSNAIVIADDKGSIGVGAGQVSRLDAAVIAVGKCRKGYRPMGAASDGQLTGAEILDTLLRIGVRAIVQPGGNPRDAEIAAAADARGMSMVLTGVSHYRY